VLQECYKSVTRALQECYRSVTRVLQECYKSVTRVLQECYKSVTRVLQECYKSVTRVLHTTPVYEEPCCFLPRDILEHRYTYVILCTIMICNVMTCHVTLRCVMCAYVCDVLEHRHTCKGVTRVLRECYRSGTTVKHSGTTLEQQ
jgi:hypothetical protein